MAYFPPGVPPPPPRSPGAAIGIGAAIAIVCAFIAGAIGGFTNIQFAYAWVLLGFLVGLGMRKARRDGPTAVAAALLSLAGSALASVISFVVYAVNGNHIPLSLVLGHMSTVISLIPHYIGWFGFLCWALATYVGWVTASGRGGGLRARRRRGLPPMAGQGQPAAGYGQPQPGYGTAANQAQPGYGTQPGYGAPATQAEPGYGQGQPQSGFAQPQPGYGAPGQAQPGDGTPGQPQPGYGAPGTQAQPWGSPAPDPDPGAAGQSPPPGRPPGA